MRRALPPGGRLVVKIGSQSLLAPDGSLDEAVVDLMVAEVADAWAAGHPCLLVSSGAVAAGLEALGLERLPTNIPDLQVAAAVGQGRLMHRYSAGFSHRGLVAGQVLLTKEVLANRDQYLHAREALHRMLARGIVPVINENDTIVVDELRLGDNDRLAAMVSHLVSASVLVLLTDTGGLFSADPKLGPADFLAAVDHADRRLDGLSGTGPLGSGGVASKVAAARMAAWSGVPTVVAAAGVAGTLRGVAAGDELGTWVEPRPDKLPARKLWIAFGQPSSGRLAIDEGAVRALVERPTSLLPVGVIRVEGTFRAGSAVEVCDPGGRLIAKGVARLGSEEMTEVMGRSGSGEAIHRDDLVVFG